MIEFTSTVQWPARCNCSLGRTGKIIIIQRSLRLRGARDLDIVSWFGVDTLRNLCNAEILWLSLVIPQQSLGRRFLLSEWWFHRRIHINHNFVTACVSFTQPSVRHVRLSESVYSDSHLHIQRFSHVQCKALYRCNFTGHRDTYYTSTYRRGLSRTINQTNSISI